MAMLFGATQSETGRFAFFFLAIVCYVGFTYWFLTGLSRALHLPLTRMWLIGPGAGAMLALIAAFTTGGTAFLYFPQSLIVTSMALTGLLMFRRMRSRLRDAGDIAVTGALSMLALSGIRYILVVAMLSARGQEPSSAFWIYNGVLDLMLSVTLAVGTMLIVTDKMRAKLQECNLELAAAKDTLEVVAKVDPLTGVWNRYAFYLCIQELSDLAAYNGCLLIVDINNLKVINDTQGHVAGDRAINAVAERLRTLIRSEDRIFRWGGDEFVVLLFNASPESAVERISRFGSVNVAANGSDAGNRRGLDFMGHRSLRRRKEHRGCANVRGYSVVLFKAGGRMIAILCLIVPFGSGCAITPRPSLCRTH